MGPASAEAPTSRTMGRDLANEGLENEGMAKDDEDDDDEESR